MEVESDIKNEKQKNEVTLIQRHVFNVRDVFPSIRV
jgi:hypothetical protein